jgi:hypothetical protein
LENVRTALEQDYGPHDPALLKQSVIWGAAADKWAPKAAYCGRDPDEYQVFVLRKSDKAYLVSCEGASNVFRASQDCLNRCLKPLEKFGGRLDRAALFYEATQDPFLEDDRALLRRLFGREQVRGIGLLVVIGLIAGVLAGLSGASASPAAFTGLATAAVAAIAQILFAWQDVRRGQLDWKVMK